MDDPLHARPDRPLRLYLVGLGLVLAAAVVGACVAFVAGLDGGGLV